MAQTGDQNQSRLHATAVATPAGGVLLTGPSGSGKSTLAFRLIKHHQAILIADDQVILSPDHTSPDYTMVLAHPPDALAGLIELRGLGLVQWHYNAPAHVHLVIELGPRDQVMRLPAPDHMRIGHLRLPRLKAHAHNLLTPELIELALRRLVPYGFSEDGVYRPIDDTVVRDA